MNDRGRSSSDPSSEEWDTAVATQTPPQPRDNLATEQHQSSMLATNAKHASLSPSSSTLLTPSAAEGLQRHSRLQSLTQQSTDTTQTSLQVDTAVVVNGTATSAVTGSTAADAPTVSDLKSELYRMTHSLVHARQQMRVSNETSAELLQRCRSQEREKQALQVELQETHDRLQACQVRAEEQRRSAAEAKLAVVSLTAERDELSAKVQEAWDRVAELSAAVRRQEVTMQSLQEDITTARHSKELIAQKHSHMEQQLRVAQEQLREHQATDQSSGAARQRLSAALQRALERVARLLSNVAYDYEQSLLCEGLGSEDATTSSDIPRGSDVHEKKIQRTATRTRGCIDDAPHVVLFTDDSDLIHTTKDNTRVMDLQSLRQAALKNGNARLHAESVLHSAETVILGDLWGAGRLLSPSSAPSHDVTDEVRAGVDAAFATATPPKRCLPSLSSSHQGLVQSQNLKAFPGAADGAEAALLSSATAFEDEASVRTALMPLLIGLKHVAAMLSNMRHERRRWAAEAAHLKRCYEGVQSQLKVTQHLSDSKESEAEVLRRRIEALQGRAKQAEVAVAEYREDDMRRLRSLAHALGCTEDWGLVQHSVELLQVRQNELRKDLQQLQEHQKVAPSVGAEHMGQAAVGGAIAEERYQQLLQRYLTLLEWVKAERPTASHESMQMQDLSSLRKAPPSPVEHGAVPAPCGLPTTAASAAVTVGESDRSSSTGPHCPLGPSATVSTSHRQSEKGTRDPDTPMLPEGHSMHEDGARTAPRETVSASPAAENGTASGFLYNSAGQTSGIASPCIPPSAAGTDDRVYTYSPTPLLRAGESAVNEVIDPPPLASPQGMMYPMHLESTSVMAAQPLTSRSAGDTDRLPLVSLSRDEGRSWPNASTLPVNPTVLQCSTTRYPSSGAITSPKHRNPYTSEDTGRSGVEGRIEYSCMFAAEVLHVIEVLDQRVSGALDRSPHA